ncbi:MAG: Uncharacterized protein G01um10147_359 [Microgenomates group bacterium Gr01-1014_7]|nr:MAG: Uncharacterized protein G01um10147_359 [Microgenomates group bacterium Gr01-1014_7]
MYQVLSIIRPSFGRKGFLKLVLVFILYTLYLILYTPAAFAQTTSGSTEFTPSEVEGLTTSLPATVSPTSPLYTDLLVHNMFHSFSCLAIGSSVIGAPCLTYQSGIPVLSQVNLSGGALGATTSIIGALYANPPISTSQYLANLGEQIGFVKPAHAQVIGSGAQVLDPISKLWQVSRNISYVAMIVVFVIIGMMVMFRNRINPQTVITAQAALPGLVIGLILITFSYFLAALISDMAFVGTNVVGYYFAAAQDQTNDPQRTNLVQHISDKNVINIFGPLTGIVGHDDVSGFLDTIIGQLPGITQLTLRTIAGFLVAQFFGPIAGGIGGIGTAISAGAGPVAFIIGPLTQLLTLLAAGIVGFTAPTFTFGFALGFIATLALIYAMIRLLLRLVSAFLTIIFLTISAPFQFMAAALPGRQGIATGWILNMLANILIFPAVLAVFYFVAFILGTDKIGTDYPLKISSSNQIENSGFIQSVSAAGGPVQFTGPTLPLFGGLNLGFIHILLAFGALMALPKIPDVVVGAIGRMGQAGQLLGQEISGGIGAGQRYAGQSQGAVSGTTGMIRQSITGEVQYQPIPGKKAAGWQPLYGRPGLISAIKKP